MALFTQQNHALVIDTATPTTQVGIIDQGTWGAFYRSTEKPLQAVFRGTAHCLAELGLEIEKIPAVAFCCGPAPLLGVRIAAMALNAWHAMYETPIYEYNTFHIASGMIHKLTKKTFHVACPAREGNSYAMHYEGDYEPVQEIYHERFLQLPSPVYFIQYNNNDPIPENAERLEYDLEPHLDLFYSDTFLQRTSHAEALLVSQRDYVKWSRKRHGAKQS